MVARISAKLSVFQFRWKIILLSWR